MARKKECCCPHCGLVWLAEVGTSDSIICPECDYGKDGGLIYDCSSFAFAYAFNSIDWTLREEGKKIHFHKDHPKYKN